MKPESAKLLRAMFDAAVDAASPSACVPPHPPSPPKGRTIVVGAGKAAVTMAKAFEDHWQGPLEGLVVTRYSHAVPCVRIEVVEASHPVPDAAGEEAARRILETLGGLSEDDLVLALISGGETTVTVRGDGQGGRNVEFLLALLLDLKDIPGIYAIAGDTDGVDGAEEIAGALITPDSLARADDLGLSAKAILADNDGHSFFEGLGDQVITGPTLTNVNDFRAIMILES